MDDVSYSGKKKPIWKRVSKKTILIVAIIVIVIGLIGGVVYFVTSDAPQEETKTIELPDETNSDFEDVADDNITPTPKDEDEEASPTPKDEDEDNTKAEISVSVQNGSGESGVAGDAADILRDAGYEVVSTGNADNFEYEDVTIQVKASAEVALELLEEDLSKSYTIGETSTDLSEDESFDALVIIGV